MRRIELNASHTQDALEHLRQIIDDMEAIHPRLRTHFLKDRDGYPPSSQTNGPASNDTDDDGTPLPPRSDPVARIVIDRDEGAGTIGQVLAEFVENIQRMRLLGTSAVGAARQALEPPKKITPEDDIWCENCLRAKVRSPRAAEGKVCTWCRDNKIDGRYPSPRMVDAHSRGALTEKHRQEILRREVEERRARKAQNKLKKRGVT